MEYDLTITVKDDKGYKTILEYKGCTGRSNNPLITEILDYHQNQIDDGIVHSEVEL